MTYDAIMNGDVAEFTVQVVRDGLHRQRTSDVLDPRMVCEGLMQGARAASCGGDAWKSASAGSWTDYPSCHLSV